MGTHVIHENNWDSSYLVSQTFFLKKTENMKGSKQTQSLYEYSVILSFSLDVHKNYLVPNTIQENQLVIHYVHIVNHSSSSVIAS